MRYKMEELVPIVGKLAEKYTSFESTSISYEKAEQLMGAVLYSIHELETEEWEPAVLAGGTVSAQQTYEIGASYVEKKTKAALDLYNQILPEFVCYGNKCLYDTFVKGLPEFFRWYDIKFEPQNTILTLDYPVLKDISAYTGIDKIYEFIKCIRLEQIFFSKFPTGYVEGVLRGYNRFYKDMAENLCEIMLISVIGHVLAMKPLLEQKFDKADYLRMQQIFGQNSLEDVKKILEKAVAAFIQEYYESDRGVLEYLNESVEGIAVRLKNAADYGMLSHMFCADCVGERNGNP